MSDRVLKNIIIFGMIALAGMLMAGTIFATDSPTCGTVEYIKTSDFSDSRVGINYESSDHQIDVSGAGGWSVTEVWLDVDDDGHSGYWLYASGPVNNFNPSGDDINSAKVKVSKLCPTPTPSPTPSATPTPTPTPSNSPTPTPSPSSSPTPTPTPEVTESPTPEPTPTNECEGDCPTPTPNPEIEEPQGGGSVIPLWAIPGSGFIDENDKIDNFIPGNTEPDLVYRDSQDNFYVNGWWIDLFIFHKLKINADFVPRGSTVTLEHAQAGI